MIRDIKYYFFVRLLYWWVSYDAGVVLRGTPELNRLLDVARKGYREPLQ